MDVDYVDATPWITVPPAGATWGDISCFALTYNGYARYEGTLGDFANETKRQYVAEGALPCDLHLLRCALFFEQRRFRHFDEEPEGLDRDYIDEVLECIRELSGGSLPGPADHLP